MATIQNTNFNGPSFASNSSDAARSGLSLTLQPIEHFIFAGVQQKLYDVFELRTAWLSSTDKARTLQKLFGNPASGTTDLAIQYPYAFLTLTGMNAESDPVVNTQYTSTVGVTNVLSGNDPRAFRVTFLPCEFTVNVEFVSNSQQKLLDFSSRWLMARRTGHLKFNVTYGRASFSVSCMGESSISLPQREGDLDNVPEYTLQTSLVVKGFISNSTLIEQQIADHVIATASVPSDKPEGAVFWSFNTKTGVETSE